MKTVKALFCITAVCALLNSGALGSEAIFSLSYRSNITGYALGGAGFGFLPKVDIVAMAVGYCDYEGAKPIELAFWDAAGMKLSSDFVTTNSATWNRTHYTPITPIALNAGDVYYLSAGYGERGWITWTGHAIAGNLGNGTFQVSPEIEFLGIAVNTNWDGVFPNEVTPGNTNLLIGANFQFVRAPLVLLSGLRPQGAQVSVDFNVFGRSPETFTLLESDQLSGPWVTNTQVSIATNLPSASYTFTTPSPAGCRFYRVQSP